MITLLLLGIGTIFLTNGISASGGLLHMYVTLSIENELDAYDLTSDLLDIYAFLSFSGLLVLLFAGANFTLADFLV